MATSRSNRRQRAAPVAAPGTWHVAPTERGLLLQNLIRAKRPEWSWGQVRKLIAGRRITVDGNLCLDGQRKLREDEVVKVLAQSLPPLPTADDVELVYLDDQVVVVNKPTGITSVRHPHERRAGRRQFQKTLDELVPQVIARLERPARGRGGRRDSARGNEPGRRVYAVHRLDRETSGLMVFARTPQAADRLTEQFRLHTTRRAYQAVVYGAVRAQRIETQLVRDRGDGRRGSADREDIGKRAVTRVRPIRRLGAMTLVECRLETGRTHQIRIHLSERGHPLCGDEKYPGPREAKAACDAARPPRLALHAVHLGFMHPQSNRLLKFDSPLPRDLQQFVDRLASTKRAKP